MSQSLREDEVLLYPLRGKVAVVTGGSRGIGAGICRVFARRGADIVTTYRTHPDEAEQVVDEIRSLGRRAFALETDVADPAMVARLFETAVAEFGGVDIAVANAAVNLRAPVLEAAEETVRRTVDVSLMGVFHTLQLGAQQMARQGRGGRLLAISSIHAECPFPNAAAYNMSKAGINHLCRTMARELAPYNITVNSIEPGWIATEGQQKRLETIDKSEIEARVPLGRLGSAEEVAHLAVYLASPLADYVTGSVFRIDGGMSLIH